MLQALVRGERVLGTIASMTELAHVQRVGLLVLVLEVALERVVAAEGSAAVGAFLRLVDTSGRGWRHPHGACNITRSDRAGRPQHMPATHTEATQDNKRAGQVPGDRGG